jgi:hypothetical protein
LTSVEAKNSKLKSGEIIRTGSSKLNIFVGEALIHHSTDNYFQKEDALYIFTYEDLIGDLNSYSTIEFWEPYSEPIFANKYKKNKSVNQNIKSNVYPRYMHQGIYDLPVKYISTEV